MAIKYSGKLTASGLFKSFIGAVIGDWSLATEQAKIQASDKQANDNFGWSVSISSDGNTAIVGARQEDTGDTDAGAAYIFIAG